MGKGRGVWRQHQPISKAHMPAAQAGHPKLIQSLYDSVVEGMEYGSIVDKLPHGVDLLSDVVKGLAAIEAIRKRPCLAYLGNVVRADNGTSGIDTSDDLPFQEMVATVPAEVDKVDVLLSTRGGSGQQVGRFVDSLRRRFNEVDFIIPSYCMSAGTIFALSGDHIWMAAGACLGPIDPQVPSASGAFVPAQALLLLVEKLQQEGQESLNQSNFVPWTAIRIIDTIDKRELGAAITATKYAETLAAEYLEKFKFRHWTHDSNGQAVTDAHRAERAKEIAAELASHDRWKSHGHAISRDVLFSNTRLKIDHPEDELERELKRTWAVCNWVFDKTNVVKMIVSSSYRYTKMETDRGAVNA